MALFRFLLYLLVFYLAFKLIIKPFLKVLLQEAFEREIDKFKNQNQQPRRPEGSIHVDYIPGKNSNKPGKFDNEGEYVDYEEVK
jgi:hypothetical protein